MPRQLLLLSLLALCVQADPELRISPDTAHLVLGHGSVGQVEFVLENTGTTSVELPLFYTLCECSFASLSRSEIPPGETASLTLRYDTRSKRLPEVQESYLTGARLYSDRPEAGFSALYLDVSITNSYRFLPFPGVIFRTIEPGTEATSSVTLFRDEGAPEILEARADQPWFSTALVEVEVEGRPAVRLDVTLDADAPAGRIGGRVELSTSLADQPRLVLPLIARRQPALQCPTSLLRLEAGDTLAVPFYSNGGEAELLEVRAPEWLRVWAGSGRVYVTTDPSYDGLTRGAQLQLLFDDPDMPCVLVPVLARERGAGAARAQLEQLGWRFDPVSAELSFARQRRDGYPLRRHLELYRLEAGAPVDVMQLSDGVFASHTYLGNQRATLVISYEPRGLAAGFVAAECRIETAGQSFRLPVFGELEGRVEAVPGGLVFSAANPEQVLFLRGLDALAAELELSGLELLSDERRDGGRKLVLRVATPATRGSLRAGSAEVPFVVRP